MKLLSCGLLFALTVTGQVTGGRVAGSTGPIGQGFGSVVYPGTGIPPITNAVTNARPAGGGGGRVGRPPGSGSYSRQGSRIVAYPIGVPYPVDYGYGGASPNVTVVNQAAPTPAVIINQNYAPEHASPVLRDYTETNLPATGSDSVEIYQAPIPSNPEGQRLQMRRSVDDDKPTIYLIAMSDGAVYSAYAYWVEGDTLHYVTTKHAHNQISLTLVDAKLSDQLNRERNVEFKLKNR